MYNKGDLKKMVAELKAKGVKVERNGITYHIYAKNRKFGGMVLKQDTNKLGSCRVLEVSGFWDDGTPRWSYVDWNKVLNDIKTYILAD